MKNTANRYARVFIRLRTRSLERPFDYAIPKSINGKLGVGSVVLVQFGRQKVLGIVGALTNETVTSPERLADNEEMLDYPPVPEPLIRLSLWVSSYYYCSVATALSLVLPPGGLPALEKKAADGEKSYSLRTPPVKPRTVRFVRLARDGAAESKAGAKAGAKEEAKAEGPTYRRTAARQRVLDLLAGGVEMPLAEVNKSAKTGGRTIRSMASLGLVEIFDRQVRRHGFRYYGTAAPDDSWLLPEGLQTAKEQECLATGDESSCIALPEEELGRLKLNRPQARALKAITGRLAETSGDSRSRPILVEGVAGAGKTEVYLRAIEAALELGQGAIVLVPEISPTHQAVRRLRRRFGERVGVLHSGLSLGERYDEYMRIRTGEADVVIGPRSALFAPVEHLGLIIIDEEHDSSFKQETEPRYDARRAALERARLEGAALVLGSATPSMESYQLVGERYVIPERATGAPMPAVEIVDMREEKDNLFSRRLMEEIDVNVKAEGKTILMLNSRGYARVLQCNECGHVWKCDNCEVSLAIHGSIGRLLCHHCGYSEEMPEICPQCKSTGLGRWGVGTERLESEVKRLFPEVPVFRLDSDTSRGYGEGPRIIDEFDRAARAILVGTQMVAKGHHFPEVTLAVVMNADLALEFPEFRAEERTFALLMQLAGRSGRAERHGKVLIQTWNGNIDCIRMAADHDLEGFYRAELERRRRLGYPPFVSLVNVMCLSHQDGKANEAAGFLKEKLEPILKDERMLGPAGLFRLKGWHRSHTLIKTLKVEDTLARIKPVIEHYRGPYRDRDVRIVIDVDPQWLS